MSADHVPLAAGVAFATLGMMSFFVCCVLIIVRVPDESSVVFGYALFSHVADLAVSTLLIAFGERAIRLILTFFAVTYEERNKVVAATVSYYERAEKDLSEEAARSRACGTLMLDVLARMKEVMEAESVQRLEMYARIKESLSGSAVVGRSSGGGGRRVRTDDAVEIVEEAAPEKRSGNASPSVASSSCCSGASTA